ncbi:MAG: HAMP domain-containing histidine kinase, partial [Myxococcales bacterium]|nr:HAMP domain-containing histidine kinase [Myxococcales bacterium]
LHELRNPLAAVMTMLELLIEEASGHLQHDLHTILAEVRRLILSLQGIGGFQGQIASGRHQAIDEAIEEAVEILQPTAARRELTLTSEVSTMPLLPLARDAIKGVVFNLVRNAIDACSPGQSIKVRARLTGDGWLELEVSDTGKGMSEEVARHCTELFFTDKESGSGIGLAICRQVAERAHGELSIVSAPGSGTTVTLRVPARTRGGTTCPESTV